MLLAALTGVVDTLATVVDVLDRGVLRGDLDAQELARLATRSPCLWLAVPVLSPSAEDSGDGVGWDYDAALSLFVLTADRLGSPRLERMLDQMIVPLLGYIPGRAWGGAPWTSGARRPTARALYSTTIDQTGLALWVVEWDQSIRLPRV